MSNDETPTWFAGVDWGSQSHRVSLSDAAGERRQRRDIGHDAAGYAALGRWLEDAAAAAPGTIAVAIETTCGPVVDALLERGFQVYAINPRQLARFNERFGMSGAKDDTRDADALARALRTDRDAFRRLRPEEPLRVRLRGATRRQETLVEERARLTNRLRDQLWRYYPQALKLTDDLADGWFLALLRHAPTPAKGARLHASTLTRLLKEHRIRRLDAERARAILREPALSLAPGVLEAAVGHVRDLLASIRLANSQIKAVRQEIDALSREMAGPQVVEPGQTVPGADSDRRDVAIVKSTPGFGRLGHAALLAEAPQAVRERDYPALRALGGVAPVTKRSGKTCRVVRRLACNKRLARTLFHAANAAMAEDARLRKLYDDLRKRGHRHARALRTVADRLLKLLCTLPTRQELYDPARRLRHAAAA